MPLPALNHRIDSLVDEAQVLISDGQLEKAIELLDETYALAAASDLEAGQAAVLLKIGRAYRNSGDYEKALSNFKTGLELYRNQNDSLGECKALENINIIYQRQGQFERALDALFSVLAIKKQLGDQVELAKTYLNIGNTYAKNGFPEQAISYYLQGKKLFEASDDQYHTAMVLNNLGNAYSALEQFDKAEENYLASINLKQSLDNQMGLATSLNNLGDFYYELVDLNNAQRYFTQSLAIVEQIEADELMATVLQNLAYTAEELGDFETAFDYYYRYDTLNARLTEQQFNEAIAEFQVKFDTEAKQNQILALEVENAAKAVTIEQEKAAKAEANATRNASLMGIGFLLIITILALFAYRQKQQLNNQLRVKADEISAQKDLISEQNEELQAITESKEKLFSIVAHNLRGPLASLTGFSDIVHHYLKKGQEEKFNKIIVETDQTVQQLNSLVNNTLVWSNSRAENIPYNPERLNLQGVVAQGFATAQGQANRKQIELKADIPNDLEVYTDINYAKTILINLLNNALKFTPEQGSVSVIARQLEELVEVTVQDTGVGMSAEQMANLFLEETNTSTLGTNGERGTGLGVKVVKEFVERGGGSLTVKSKQHEGSQFIFTWPLHA